MDENNSIGKYVKFSISLTYNQEVLSTYTIHN